MHRPFRVCAGPGKRPAKAAGRTRRGGRETSSLEISEMPEDVRASRDETPIDVSVVTPSFNMLSYLKRCCASVADQEGVSVEHIVVDGMSDDGTVEWLKRNEGVVAVVEKDNGMYDAVNKGFGRASGGIVAYLNCDEQYLPGTLKFVKEYLTNHPDVDILFGDALLVRPDGSLISYRKGYHPRWYYILSSHLYVLSCTMFLRRRIVADGFRFDDGYRDVGDEEFVVRALRHGYRARHVSRYLAAFTMTGKNMSAAPNAPAEAKRFARGAPTWVRLLKYPLNVARLAEKVLSGAYFQKMPLEYSVYASDSADRRKTFTTSKASFRWRTG